MEVDIRARHIVVNEDLQKQIERSIDRAIDRHKSRIGRISVYLADLNGPRGGIDKLCQITADVRGTRPVLILQRGDNLVATVNHAARRLGYRIGRKIHRQRVAGTPEHRATIREA